jgi:hypothetical protein
LYTFHQTNKALNISNDIKQRVQNIMKSKYYKNAYSKSNLGKDLKMNNNFSMMSYYLPFDGIGYLFYIEKLLQGVKFNMVYLFMDKNYFWINSSVDKNYFWINFPYVLFFIEVI